ncbi:MAG: hypothetical protein KAQ89_00145 [Planctomycetes bacterium]|nr:hypothetical protein [Planctomycetota bacterium]
MESVEGLKERELANKDITTCPECGGKDISFEYQNCLCHRTYEGNGVTCWTAPHCNSCGYEGIGNSSGGLWYKPNGW